MDQAAGRSFRDRVAGALLAPLEAPDVHDLRARLIPPDVAVDLDVHGGTDAAVLVPLYEQDGEVHAVFTRRREDLRRHAGEISFPGGLAEPDEELPAAALRESEEELGLAPADVELVGALPSVHTRVTGILIVPFVGLLHAPPRFTPNEAEIAEILEFPLAQLMAATTEREFEFESRRFRTFVFDMEGQVIWGATARILHSFLELLSE